ncbi:interleukin-6 receptor subunit beta-like [Gigantopelta aegis]|uniref:interleukin-6 receptor subunit beta-like n=1 Tax=Gigantopelta aegis TaxID=1735272 RepID=UPI001B88D46C|nr:interleukin-6 receptor subunit beta-like [Gigantopelta aegis]
MQCNWTLGHYENLDNIAVTLLWTSAGAEGWSNCISFTKTSCFWNKTEFPKMNPLWMNVTVHNQRRPSSVATSMFNINKIMIVKPSPVQNLVSETVNSECVDLRWEHSQSTKGVMYRVNYTSGVEWVTVVSNISLWNYRVCDLSPFTNYTFLVEAHPNKSEGFWSDPRQTLSKTTDDVPEVGPNITSGSYIEECDKGRRNVTLYFKAPREELRNGILTRFELKIKNRETGDTYSQLASVEETTAVLNLKCDTVYDVEMFAMTRVGASKTPSTITINKYAAVTMPRLFRIQTIENGSSKVMAKWDAPEDGERTITTTVFWCIRFRAPNICKEPFEWIVVKGKNEVALPLENVLNYLFAVSRDTEAGSSGLSWTRCLYRFNKKPDVPSDVRVSSSGNDLTLNVMWNGLWCNSNSMSLLSKYIILYNTVGSSEPNKSVSVDRFDSSYKLGGLKKENYSIWMQAKSDSGMLGPISRPVFEVPVDNSLSTGEIVGISFGCLFGLFFIASGVFFLFRVCKHGCRKDKILFPRDTKKFISQYIVPDMNGAYTKDKLEEESKKVSVNGNAQTVLENDTVIGRQISTVSTDSGHGSLEDGKKSGGTSPLSANFPPLKEDDEWTKVSTDSDSTNSTRPVDYSRFAKAEDSSPAQHQGTVGLVLGHSNPVFAHSTISKESITSGPSAAAAKVPEPVSGHSVDSYVTVGGDGNVEVKTSSDESFTAPDEVPEPVSGNSVDPYVTVGGDGNVEVKTSSDESFTAPDEVPELISWHSVDPYVTVGGDGNIAPAQLHIPFDDKNSDSHDINEICIKTSDESCAHAVESPSDRRTNQMSVQDVDSSCVQHTDPPSAQGEDKPGEDLPSAEDGGPSLSQQCISAGVENSHPSHGMIDVKQDDNSEPLYVDTNFSPCTKDTDPSDSKYHTSDQVQKIDPPYIQSTDAPYIQNTDPPYVQNSDLPYVKNTDPLYVQNTDPPYVQNSDSPYVHNGDPPYV